MKRSVYLKLLMRRIIRLQASLRKSRDEIKLLRLGRLQAETLWAIKTWGGELKRREYWGHCLRRDFWLNQSIVRSLISRGYLCIKATRLILTALGRKMAAFNPQNIRYIERVTPQIIGFHRWTKGRHARTPSKHPKYSAEELEAACRFILNEVDSGKVIRNDGSINEDKLRIASQEYCENCSYNKPYLIYLALLQLKRRGQITRSYKNYMPIWRRVVVPVDEAKTGR